MRTRLRNARPVQAMRISGTCTTMAPTLSGSGCTMASSTVRSLQHAATDPQRHYDPSCVVFAKDLDAGNKRLLQSSSCWCPSQLQNVIMTKNKMELTLRITVHMSISFLFDLLLRSCLFSFSFCHMHACMQHKAKEASSCCDATPEVQQQFMKDLQDAVELGHVMYESLLYICTTSCLA